MIETYRLIGAPHLGGACRFSPSCSEYATEAFRRHSLGYASMLTLRRLGRCRPGGPAGFDPVPLDSHICCQHRGPHESAR